MQVETNGHEVSFGRVAFTNSAALFDDAAASPAVDATHRNAARAKRAR